LEEGRSEYDKDSSVIRDWWVRIKSSGWRLKVGIRDMEGDVLIACG